MSRRPAGVAGLALALVTGCGEAARDPGTPAAPAAQVASPQAPAPAPAPAPATPACRDWSGIDAATLEPLPPGPFVAAFEQVWDLVRRRHFDPTLGCRDWPALRLRYGRDVAAAGDAGAAYAAMNGLLAELGHSHVGVVGPGERETPADAGPARPGLEARWIGEELIVVASERPQVPRGSRILAIEDTPIEELIVRADARRRGGSRALAIAEAVDGQLACRAGARRRLRIEVATGQVAREVAVSCELPPGQLVSLGNLRDLPTVVEHDLVAPGIGRLSFNLWMLPMLPRIEAALADLRRRGATSLVLDLRGNPGGVGTMAVPVAALLLQAEASLGRLTFRDFTNELRVRPAPGAFSGPVVALVDEGTASTSEIFLTGMRDAGRVQIVGGGPSAGAALPSVVEEIGGGALLQYVVGDYVSPAGARAEGKGITPDRVVAETRAAFAAGKDPVLDAAIEFLQGLPTPSPTAPP